MLPGQRVIRRDFQRDPVRAIAALVNTPPFVKVFQFDVEALVEPCVTAITEINVSVADRGGAVPSVIEIPYCSEGALSYEDKYLRDGGKKTSKSAAEGMANLARVIDSPMLAAEIKKRVTELALKAYSILGCSGIALFDFTMGTDKNEIYFELKKITRSREHSLFAQFTTAAPNLTHRES